MINRTRTDKTKLNYLYRAGTLVKRYRKEKPLIADSINYELFVDWLVGLKPTIQVSTWNQYKASTVELLKKLCEQDALSKLEPIGSEGCLRASNKTSANKAKHITEYQEQRIRRNLMKLSANGDPWMRALLAYFETILTVGIRPHEIPDCLYQENPPDEFSGSGPVLIVKNAKATNGRSFGEFRYIGLQNVSEKNRLFIKMAIYAATNCPNDKNNQMIYTEFYKGLQERYARLIRSLFPRNKLNITLYSCRHQCIADLKKGGYQLNEIAAIVGHGNDATASEHYGKKRYGRKRGGLALANPNDIQKIKSVINNKIKRRDQTKTAGINM